MEKLDKKQYEAATSTGQYVLCNSKAGSGKTKTLMNRCLYLLENGAKAEEIMLVTFTNKAAQEMMTRIKKLTPEGGKIMCGTFHNIALYFLRRYADVLDYDSAFTVVSPDDAEKMIKDIVKDYAKVNDLNEDTVKALKPKRILNEYSASRNLNVDFTSYLEDKQYILGLVPMIREIIESYESRKLINDLMDFDDLLTNFNCLLHVPEIKKEITNRFKYILVDEFQDVNDVQYSIVDNLLEDDSKLFVVGDPYQCIYGFRGSKIEHITNFEDFYGAHVVSLDTNYRSTQEILNLAAQVTGGRAHMSAYNGSGAEPKMFISKGNYGNVANEKIAKQVVNNIKHLIDVEKENPEEIAVLVRSTNQIHLLEAELKARGIPYVMRAGFSYFEKVHIKDTLSFLSILVNNKNKLGLSRVLNLFKGFGPKSIKSFIEEYETIGEDMGCMNYNITNGLFKLTKSAKEGFETFYNLYTKVSSERTVEEKVSTFLNEFYYDYLIKEYPDDVEARLSDTASLVNMSKKYDKLEEFINDVMVDSSINNKETGKEKEKKIIISTIHRAKGLEWDHVFICNMESLYQYKGDYDEEDVDDFEVNEDNRLMYVAITRAKKCLEIYSTSNDFYGYGKGRVNLTHTLRDVRFKRIYSI